ncbi:tetratricopeptide (TPR) repeat protein [Rhizomicrobium palustre]|uniref:Tetratricopeptide (TPR) repeat protein n=1 Tax=Rhizomicrobium palustre TaxID=189966 RepID=A0A846N326_9PROT|nr:hypothetical protein [Rhizomicrobium palustre]NIK89885.1 tetratricopeptide (TPR) repeat protein [Rhizomicrobium palustre]
MKQIKAFVGHSFNQADKPVVDAFLDYFDQLTGIVPHFSWEHATAAEPKELAEKVLAIIDGKNTFIGICTRNEFAASPAVLKPTFWGTSHRKVAVTSLQAKTSDWVIQEIGLAKGRGMELVLLVEKGLRAPGGLQGNIEYIEFERDKPSLVFGKIVEMIKALSPKFPSASVASEPPATTGEAEADAEADPVPDIAPKPEWKLDEYKFGAFRAYLRKDDEALKKIDAAFRESPVNDGAETVAEWDANLEYMKVFLGRGGSIVKLMGLAQQYPNSDSILVLLARAYSHYDQFAEAASVFVQAAELPLGAGKSSLYRGFAAVEYAKAKKPSDVILQINMVKPAVAGDVAGELKLLSALREIAEAQKSDGLLIAAMERIVDIAPDDFEIRFKLAFKHSEMGNEELALYHYNKIPWESREAHVWNNLGVALDNLKMPVKAVNAYRAAEDRGETLAMSNLGQKFLRAGFSNEAKVIFEKGRTFENYHKNIDAGLAQLKDVPEEENKTLTETMDKLRPKAEFYKALGEAVTSAEGVTIGEKWQRGDRVLIFKFEGNNFSAKSTYEVASNSLANALTTGLGLQPVPEKYEEVLEGTINGRIIEAMIKRKKLGEASTPSSLLGLGGDSKTKVLMWISSDNKSIHAAENPYSTNPIFYVLRSVV